MCAARHHSLATVARRAGLLLVSGHVLLGAGEDTAARLRLTKALTHTHRHLGNAQIMAQVGVFFSIIFKPLSIYLFIYYYSFIFHALFF